MGYPRPSLRRHPIATINTIHTLSLRRGGKLLRETILDRIVMQFQDEFHNEYTNIKGIKHGSAHGFIPPQQDGFLSINMKADQPSGELAGWK
jgi:hypothetical protein